MTEALAPRTAIPLTQCPGGGWHCLTRCEQEESPLARSLKGDVARVALDLVGPTSAPSLTSTHTSKGASPGKAQLEADELPRGCQPLCADCGGPDRDGHVTSLCYEDAGQTLHPLENARERLRQSVLARINERRREVFPDTPETATA
jgi:hypothetical protein